MTPIRKMLELLAFSNLWLALGAGASVWTLTVVASVPFHSVPIIIVFLMAFSIYNLNHPARLAFGERCGRWLLSLAVRARKVKMQNRAMGLRLFAYND